MDAETNLLTDQEQTTLTNVHVSQEQLLLSNETDRNNGNSQSMYEHQVGGVGGPGTTLYPGNQFLPPTNGNQNPEQHCFSSGRQIQF